MKDYEVRLVEEYLQAKDRLDKLDKFVESRKVNNIVDPKEHKLMLIQVEIMDEYVDILQKRIKLHKGIKLDEYANDF